MPLSDQSFLQSLCFWVDLYVLYEPFAAKKPQKAHKAQIVLSKEVTVIFKRS
jgi:hypothetical protein